MLYFMISLVGALIAGAVAAGKNRNALGWGALGFLLPLIGVIVALCLEAWPTLDPNQQLQ